MAWEVLLLWLVAVALVAFVRQWWYLRHFERRGLPFNPGQPFVGCMAPFILRRMGIAELTLKMYEARNVAGATDAPAVGFFDLWQPVTLLRDPALVRAVTVKYFDHFRNHRPVPALQEGCLRRSLFALRDQHWKDLRATLSPAFTSSKMRIVFDLVSKCGLQSADFLMKQCKELHDGSEGIYEVEFKDLFTRFATDVIATSAFGIECDSLGQPNNEFYTMGKDLTTFGGLKSIAILIKTMAPKIASVLGLTFLSRRATAFFRALVRDAVVQRAERGLWRPDVLQLMVEARAGRLGPTPAPGRPRVEMTEEDIQGQALLFFIAGFETVSLLISFCCYALAVHTDVQERLQQEIDEVFEANNGDIDYDVLQRMKYLDMVVCETLRLFPPAAASDRECARDVQLPLGGGRRPLAVRKGDLLWVPVIGLHRDPRFWPRPDAFDPERFRRRDDVVPFAFLPFGAGPRVCLAQRFALLEAKVALVHLLRRLELTRVGRTHWPVRLKPSGFNTASADGFWCGVRLRRLNAT